MDVTQYTMTGLRDAIAAKKVSSVEATRAFLDRIARLDPQVHAFNELYPERALERAKAVDSGGVTGTLAGVPISIKDNLCTTWGHTTCSSKILANFKAPYDATVVRKLEAAGAVIVGKTNLDEFAMGSSTENSSRGPTRNPWGTQFVPGGSSGGSAASLAAGFAAASLGSDTGGSIRQPAALCGIVGLKPTYGLVSRYGLVAFASSLDQIGPFTRDVADCALMLSVIAGHDPMDSTSAANSVSGATDYTRELEQPVKGLRLGVAKQYMSDANDASVAESVRGAIEEYRAMGASVVEVDLPHTEYGIPTYYIVATAEASSNLARYDGVHYGYRTARPDDLMDLYAASRAEGFGDEVKRRIMLGTFVLSSGYHDAYYLRALKVRRLIKQDFDAAFTQCDAIICPTTPSPAFQFGEKSGDPLQMYLSDVYTVNCNLAGIAGVSIPCGFTEKSNHRLPLGLQLLGPTFSEARLLRIARMYEARHDFGAERPGNLA
jgi:aspartyl-tRNA(Asn)/glutamyl-tRNA(Gln) amidotransferase subunit A